MVTVEMNLLTKLEMFEVPAYRCSCPSSEGDLHVYKLGISFYIFFLVYLYFFFSLS